MSETIQIETGALPDAAVIWMHGLGADASDFPPTIPYLKLPESLRIRFLFPNAPVRPVTINGGYEMRSWYDILSMDSGREINAHELDASVKTITGMINEQLAAGIPAERILLVGFSQGGAVAYETGLQSPVVIGGIAAMSTYLPRTLEALSITAPKALPILVLHGDYDDVVPFSMANDAVNRLNDVGFSPEFHQYSMTHEVSIESLTTLGNWMTQCLLK